MEIINREDDQEIYLKYKLLNYQILYFCIFVILFGISLKKN